MLFDLSHKQYNGIINEWLHCLTSEAIGRFLVNNILFDSAMMSGHAAHPILFN